MAKKQPELYRIPRKPGYLGGYDWRATALGCLLLVVVNFVATQYIAAKFQYQPALGAPILRAKSGGVYQPFSWIAWGWRYCTSQDERIRRPFFVGEMIVFAGSLACVGIFFVLAGRRARKLTENAEDLHGSARWADEDDIRDTGLLTTKHGVYVGGWCPEGGHRLSYLRHNGPEHVLAFAPTRSGKGVGLVIPSLLAWEESAVIYDIKGENWAKTAGFRSQQGHLCFKFSPVEEQASSRFNPLSEVRVFTPRDVSDAQNIANMIVRTGGQPAGALLAGCRRVHYDGNDSARLLRSGARRPRCLPRRPVARIHPTRLRLSRDARRTAELRARSWACARLAHVNGRSDAHSSSGPREGAGNARQRGP